MAHSVPDKAEGQWGVANRDWHAHFGQSGGNITPSRRKVTLPTKIVVIWRAMDVQPANLAHFHITLTIPCDHRTIYTNSSARAYTISNIALPGIYFNKVYWISEKAMLSTVNHIHYGTYSGHWWLVNGNIVVAASTLHKKTGDHATPTRCPCNICCNICDMERQVAHAFINLQQSWFNQVTEIPVPKTWQTTDQTLDYPLDKITHTNDIVCKTAIIQLNETHVHSYPLFVANKQP